MKLSISNIAWSKEFDEEMYKYMYSLGFDAIEIAPTRIIEKEPYQHIDQAKQYAKKLKEKYNLKISSIQSIWYGRQEKIFGTREERGKLIKYTKEAIDFAEAINCKNLVFGCPKNRNINDLKKDYKIALNFFNEIGNYANERNIYFLIEPNPKIYNTNFITKTTEAINIVKEINNEGIKINLDLGAMIQNNENIDILKNNINYIKHIHISEPNLEYINERAMTIDLIKMMKQNNYDGYISIEMKNQNNIHKVKKIMKYILELVKGENNAI